MRFFNLFNNKDKEERKYDNKNDGSNVMYTSLSSILGKNKNSVSNYHLQYSDVIRSAINPYIRIIGKLDLAYTVKDEVQEDNHLVELLRYPNKMDTLQTLLEKITTNIMLTNNAYIIISRNDKYNINELNVINPISVVINNDTINNIEVITYTFMLANRQEVTYSVNDVIHLRREFSTDSNFFGVDTNRIIDKLVEVIDITDESIKSSIENTHKLKFLLKMRGVMKEEDGRKQVETFQSLIEDGVGIIPQQVDFTQLKYDAFIPDYKIHDSKVKRVYDYFGVNPNIVNSSYTEDEFNAFYESNIEPIIVMLNLEFNRKLFSIQERRKGNKITLVSTGLQFTSMSTKLQMTDLIDRGAITINEWRTIMNLPNLEHGDIPIRRLDTAAIDVNGEAIKTDDNSEHAIIE